jgi:cytidylate kinase
MRKLTIAIDGPSGVGKGTVARAIAQALGYRHVDSGAMYRAVGWKALRDGVPIDDEAALEALAKRSRIVVTDSRIASTKPTHARDPHAAIDRAAASVARLPRVRSVLVAATARVRPGGGICDGRPRHRRRCVPGADVKIYRMPRPGTPPPRQRSAQPPCPAVSDVARMLTETRS